DLPHVSAKRAGEALRDGRGAGGRPGAVAAGRADRGPAGRATGARLAVVQAATAAERDAKETALQDVTRQRDVAREQKRRTRAALDTMVSPEMIERLGSQKDLPRGQREFLQKALGYYKEFAAEAATGEEGRKLEADAQFRVGYLLLALGRPKEAVTAYRAAVPIYAALAADFPAVPDYRSSLAQSHNNLGMMLAETGQRAEAEPAFRTAVAIQSKLANDF